MNARRFAAAAGTALVAIGCRPSFEEPTFFDCHADVDCEQGYSCHQSFGIRFCAPSCATVAGDPEYLCTPIGDGGVALRRCGPGQPCESVGIEVNCVAGALDGGMVGVCEPGSACLGTADCYDGGVVDDSSRGCTTDLFPISSPAYYGRCVESCQLDAAGEGYWDGCPEGMECYFPTYGDVEPLQPGRRGLCLPGCDRHRSACAPGWSCISTITPNGDVGACVLRGIGTPCDLTTEEGQPCTVGVCLAFTTIGLETTVMGICASPCQMPANECPDQYTCVPNPLDLVSAPSVPYGYDGICLPGWTSLPCLDDSDCLDTFGGHPLACSEFDNGLTRCTTACSGGECPSAFSDNPLSALNACVEDVLGEERCVGLWWSF